MQTALLAHREPYVDLLGRLSARSVTRHHDAYADVGWDDPENAVDRDDPRFELSDDDPLAATEWYRALPPAARARLGLHHLARTMKTGVEFEAVLSRGLLEFASTRPNGSPEFRYAYHEVIEESQHSLMFQEFVNRTGFDVRGLGVLEARGARRVPRLGRTFPEAFFLHVLGGETPIDWVQRRALASSGGPRHPLVRRIMQIHVTEEARHLCFAQRFLEESVPRLGVVARARLRLYAPFILAGTVAPMLRLSGDVVRAHLIPAEVVREVHASSAHRARVREGIRPVRDLCARIGILTPRLEWWWTWLGL
jgi:hypothetical protein